MGQGRDFLNAVLQPAIDTGIPFVAGVIVALSIAGCPQPTDPGPRLVILLHESENGPLPPYAIGAANELSSAGVQVRMVDDDVTDGQGETPDWLQPALEPGRLVMGPSQQDDALVVLSGTKLIKAIPLPGTREGIVEAAK